jgi:hypothetical protein
MIDQNLLEDYPFEVNNTLSKFGKGLFAEKIVRLVLLSPGLLRPQPGNDECLDPAPFAFE